MGHIEIQRGLVQEMPEFAVGAASLGEPAGIGHPLARSGEENIVDRPDPRKRLPGVDGHAYDEGDGQQANYESPSDQRGSRDFHHE